MTVIPSRPLASAACAVLLAAAALPARAEPSSHPCDDFVRRLPNVTRAVCEAAQLVPGGATSVKGVPLYVRDIKNENAKLRVLVLGAIHGDELSSASLALHWIRLATDEKPQLPQAVHWRFVPVVNPDGLLARPPRRTNASGVDLNRNF